LRSLRPGYDEAARKEAVNKRRAAIFGAVVVGGIAVGMTVFNLITPTEKSKQEAAERAKQAAKQAEVQRLQGRWTGTTRYGKGTYWTYNQTWEFSGDKVTIRTDKVSDFDFFRSGMDGTFEFGIDLDNPKTISIGREEGRSAFGIYEFSGDELKICYSRKEPPAGFGVGQSHNVVLRRTAK